MGQFGRSERGPAKRSRGEIHSPSGELARPVRSVERRPDEPAHLREGSERETYRFSFVALCDNLWHSVMYLALFVTEMSLALQLKQVRSYHCSPAY